MKVLVVGTGLIGTSIGLGLLGAGHEVFLQDIDEAALNTALARTSAKRWQGETDFDLAVVATPPAATRELIVDLVRRLPGAVITDVASIKAQVVGDLTELTAEEQSRVVGGHPMAGREVSGAAAARERLFLDRTWIITPLPTSSAHAVALVTQLATDLGAVPVVRGVAEHDRAVALISHAPQVVASVLAGELISAEQDDVALAGQGIRDTVRIAGSDPALWRDILAGNAANVQQVVSDVAIKLQRISDSLARRDFSAVEQVLVAGREGHGRLPGKHGSSARSTASIVVRIADQPGELARLFAAAGAAGVNLEDVRIDHALGRMTGMVELTVAAELLDRLVTALIQEGFEVVN